MSIEQARAFIEKVKNDEDLQKRLNEAQDAERRLEVARAMGYEFSQEEARQAQYSELTEEELKSVSGGYGYMPPSSENYVCVKDD